MFACMNDFANALHFLEGVLHVAFRRSPWIIVVPQLAIREWVTIAFCTAMSPSVFIPAIGDSYRIEVYTNLVLALMWWGVETAPPSDFVIVILHVLGTTVDFRIIEHVRGEFVALDEHFIANNRPGMP